ncbi:uncharacterized protein TM35_000741040 [Trypanosoma theileri]|uniref:Mucin TcMUCII n=1 Tax=Trypanosoma theileri TaxID=67003 RepID=A0A1X0NFB8_9TRYP|nr:uncharacterized protein TM35_000741040 [Trypanosoma theileri]ORC83357.1 hypothetical protein TM35_000741040 [Trypanosoma theileri]
MMMRRVMCVLAVVLCCACGYTMTAAAAVDNDSPSGRGVSRGAVEVSCGAGGALRVRPAAESEWLTCGAGSRVSACGKYADLCSQRTTRAARTKTTTTTSTVNAGQPKAVMAIWGMGSWGNVNLSVPTSPKQEPARVNTHSGTDNSALNLPLVTEERKGSLVSNEVESHSVTGDVTVSPSQVQVQEQQKVVRQTEDGQSLQVSQPKEQSSSLLGGGAKATSVTEDDSVQHPEVTTEGSHEAEAGATEGHTNANPTLTTSPSGEQASNPSPPQDQSAESTTSSKANDDTSLNSSLPTETTSTTPASPENTTTEAPTTTPSPVPVPNAEISSNITSTVLNNKTNVDSSVNPVWMHTAAPLLIMAVWFSATVC